MVLKRNVHFQLFNTDCRTICRSLICSKFRERFATNLYSSSFKGCFEFPIFCRDHFPNRNRLQERTVDGCYLECQKENCTSRQNEPIYFALKVMLHITLSLSVYGKFQLHYIFETFNRFIGYSDLDSFLIKLVIITIKCT